MTEYIGSHSACCSMLVFLLEREGERAGVRARTSGRARERADGRVGRRERRKKGRVRECMMRFCGCRDFQVEFKHV